MEVAEQINISQAQVSRLEKNALKIMRKYLLGNKSAKNNTSGERTDCLKVSCQIK